jgi:ribonucleoside-diphosphate reductase alpha chain
MRLLTNVSQMTDIKNVPSVAKANKLMHSVGLGAMNLHGHLVTQGMMYGSKESIDFIDCFMEAMNYYSLKSSMEIAKEQRKTFDGFKKSEYANGNYFNQYVSKEDNLPSDVVLKALGNVPNITTSMWEKLAEDVKEYGLFHA